MDECRSTPNRPQMQGEKTEEPMKKTLATLVAVTVLSLGAAFAQEAAKPADKPTTTSTEKKETKTEETKATDKGTTTKKKSTKKSKKSSKSDKGKSTEAKTETTKTETEKKN